MRVPGFADPGEVKIDADYLTPFTTLALRTSHGDLDVSFAPDAPGRWSFSYEELAPRAVVIDVGIEIPVAALDEVIGSKEAAGRAKDLEDLARLYLVRDERRRHGRPSMDTTPP